MQCPQCKNDVPVTEAQYGALYTCPKCVAVYFVGFDGQPEFGDMEIPIEPIVEVTAHVQEEVVPVEETFINDFSLNPVMDAAVVPEAHFESSSAFAAAAQEITDYANQEEVVSSISYDVVISGLDTKEVMQAFKDAIEDSKFGWLTQDILSQIKNGQSTLKNLNPIQAFVLANRIQYLDLDIEWKQNVAF